MRMRMLKPSPRYNVLSLRVSDEDLMAIKTLLLREQITISDLMREALQVVRERLEEPNRLPPGLDAGVPSLRQIN